jgi:chromatin assembly factor 1 subunit B
MAAPETSADTPEMSSVPSLTAGSGVSMHGGVPMYTPPQTPGYVSATPVMHASSNTGAGAGVGAGVKRENENGEDASRDKRRRIAPTLISEQ